MVVGTGQFVARKVKGVLAVLRYKTKFVRFS